MAIERLPEEPFAQLYVSLIRDPDLSDAECRVYLELLSYKWQNASCFPGQKRIGADIGKSERGVRNALIELEKKGLIERHHRGQRYTDEYTFPSGKPTIQTSESTESSDRQILPFPIDLDRQKTTDSVPDRQNSTSPDRQETAVKEETIETESVVKTRKPVNPIVPIEQIEDEDVRGIAVALELDFLKQKEIVRIRKEIDRSIYSHLDFVKVAEGYVAWQETKPEKKRDTDRVSAFIHQLEFKRTFTSYFKETAPRPDRKPITSSDASNTEYVRYDTPITTDIPQFVAFFNAVKSTGQCDRKTWKTLEGLGKQVKGDGTLLFIASDEQEKRKIERDYRRRISSGCRDAGLTFEIACGA